MSSKSQNRFFLVGCPRSGTTLLQSLLASHSQVISFPESHFFLKVFPDYQNSFKLWFRRDVKKMSQKRIRQFLSKMSREDYLERLPPLPWSQKQYGEMIINLLDELMIEEGKEIWLEKTPSHLHEIPQIQRLIPNAKFIHILRNGADTVASLYEVRLKYPELWRSEKADFHRACDSWLKDIQISYSYYKSNNHTFVRYENLVTDTSAVIDRVCDFMGIKYEPEMLGNYRHTAQELISGKEAWKAKVSQNIESQKLVKFKKLFNAHEQNQILKYLSKHAIKTSEPIFQGLWQS